MKYDFTGKAYFISGAAKGLGLAIARGLAEAGAVVGMADIDQSALETSVNEINQQGGQVIGYPGDLASQETFLGFGEAFSKQVGGLDGVINNASLLIYEPLQQIEEAVVDRMIGAGIKTSIWGSQLLQKYRKPDVQVNIINFSSPVAFKGIPGTLVYSLIKSATTSINRTLAAELGPQGIRVNAVAPGSVPTPGALQYVSAEEYEKRSANIPLRRLGQAEDVVKAIFYLLSDDASFVNGAVLSVDGGIIAGY